MKAYREANRDKLNAKKREKVHCDACDVDISRSGIAKHNKQKSHLDNVKIKADGNEVKKTRHCDKCDIDVVKTSWSVHEKSEQHTGIKQTRHCDSCNQDVGLRAWGWHVKSKKHINNSEK